MRFTKYAYDLKWTCDVHSNQPVCTFPEFAPDHQSPHNILDSLNDHCLREIFLKLTKFDQCEVAQVCQRFRAVVKTYFTPKRFEITNMNCTPLWKLEKFFRVFGASIQTANITMSGCSDIILVFLSKYCENLVELSGETGLKNTINDMAAMFPRLRQLHLKHEGLADIVFQPNARIESISVQKIRQLPSIQFPELRHLKVRIDGNKASIAQFFALNPQIEKLELSAGKRIPMSIVLPHLPRLQEFHANIRFSANDARAFGQLKHLHTLRINTMNGDHAAILRVLIKTGVQLKRFEMMKWYPPTSPEIGCIVQIKCLVHLKVSKLNDEQLVRVVDNCTNLTGIETESVDITPS